MQAYYVLGMSRGIHAEEIEDAYHREAIRLRRIRSSPGAEPLGGRALESYSSAVDEFFRGLLPGFYDSSMGTRKSLDLELHLSTQEAAAGGVFPVQVPVWEQCPECEGSGFSQGFVCTGCDGRGRIAAQREFSLCVPAHVSDETRVVLSMEDIGLKDVLLELVIRIDPRLDHETG